jgi:non-homologous end joining protein Ku
MPHANWKGFLRLSVVSCPIYLSPATTGSKPDPAAPGMGAAR